MTEIINMTRQEMIPIILEDIKRGAPKTILPTEEEGQLTLYLLKTFEYFCPRNNHFYKLVRVDDE